MTRRKFIQKLMTTGSVMIAGASWLVRKAAPRKFVWAFRVKKYPGSLRPLRDVSKQSKWSG
ncbi:MAG: hypothetical protein ACYSWZ_26860 [Planctomycetota bacterium]